MFHKNLIVNILIVAALLAAGYVAYQYLVPCTTCTSNGGCASGSCSHIASEQE